MRKCVKYILYNNRFHIVQTRTPHNLQLNLQLGVSEMDEKAEVNYSIFQLYR